MASVVTNCKAPLLAIVKPLTLPMAVTSFVSVFFDESAESKKNNSAELNAKVCVAFAAKRPVRLTV